MGLWSEIFLGPAQDPYQRNPAYEWRTMDVSKLKPRRGHGLHGRPGSRYRKLPIAVHPDGRIIDGHWRYYNVLPRSGKVGVWVKVK